VGHAAEVALHVGRAGDAQEQRLAVARLGLEPHLAEIVGADHPVALAEVHVEVLGGERPRVRGEAVGVG
jgi:hypothetical protein